jgi:hypothetical protein
MYQNASTHLLDSAINLPAIRQLIKQFSRAIAILAKTSNIARAIAWAFETGSHRVVSLPAAFVSSLGARLTRAAPRGVV